ncbi:MAG: ABC transporter ATP-binding protein [Chlamydiales bacterium]
MHTNFNTGARLPPAIKIEGFYLVNFMKEAVICHDLKKNYGEEESLMKVLRGIELVIKEGELTMIVGPSGCGKTTLLSVITAILSQDSGECLIYGENVQKMNEMDKTAFRKRNIGFIFQAYHLIPSFSALENTSIPLLLNNVEEEEAYERARNMLIQVGLEHRMDAIPSHMSGGEQQRVAICRGCIHNPKLIVCDEPTSTLDHQTGVKVLELFRSIAVNEKKAIIVVTHDTRIYEFADRILQMEDGKIIGEI